MSKSQPTEAQMIGALKQMEAEQKAEDVARESAYRSTRFMRRKRSMAG